MKRDYGTDICRAIFMFFIVLQHMAGFTGHNIPWFTNVVSFGVTGFVFISGWYGIRFSIVRLLKLWGVAVWCAVLVFLYTGGHSLNNFLSILYGWWFLNAYTILCLVAPLLNLGVEKAIESGRQKEVAIPIALLVFGWINATSISRIEWLVPQPSGISPTSFLTLACIYVFARLAKMYLDVRKVLFNKIVLAALVAVCLCFNAIGLGSIASITTLFFVAVIFLGMRKLQIPDVFGRFFVWLAPSMFSVYLLHVGFAFSSHGAMLVQQLVSVGIPVLMTHVLSSLIVFSICLMVDVPRRLSVWCVALVVGAISNECTKRLP